MLEIAIMLEGQNGLDWQRFQRIAHAVEDLGFVGLYRSDHYTNAAPPDLDSLECWVSLAWLATNTRRIEFGQLVSPVSFRQPTMLARMARDVDDLSGGRLTLGLGAGWQEREHTNYGWDLLELKERFVRLGEGVQIVKHLLHDSAPFSFTGKYFRTNDAVMLPRPQRRIPILIGGTGEKKTMPLVAKYADEWNATFQTPANYRRLNTLLDQLLITNNRLPSSVRRSLMTGLVFGKNDADVQRQLTARNRTLEQMRERGVVVGTASACVEHLGQLAQAGVQRVMFQWFNFDDLDGLEAFAHAVLPQFK
jgi:F420-dependent oxidoreductase-like protein